MTRKTLVSQTPEQQKYLSRLLGCRYNIVYRLGKLNAAADTLSRRKASSSDDATLLHLLSSLMSDFFGQIVNAAKSDPKYLHTRSTVIADPTRLPNYRMHDDLLLYKNANVIPDDDALKRTVFNKVHTSVMGGHLGIKGMVSHITRSFFWQDMQDDIGR